MSQSHRQLQTTSVSRLLPFVLPLVLFASLGFGQNAHERQIVEVAPVLAVKGVDIPAEYLAGLQHELVEDLGKTQHFSGLPVTSNRTGGLRLTCTVMEFKHGNRAKRIISTEIGRMAGVGAARLKVYARLTTADGQPFLDKEIEGAQKSTVNPDAPTAGSPALIGIEAQKIVDEVKKTYHKK